MSAHSWLVAARLRDLDIDAELALTVTQFGADDATVLSETHERRIRRDPVRLQRAEVGNGLDQIRLALAVRALEHLDTRVQLEFGGAVIPKIPQAQVGDVHDAPLAHEQVRLQQVAEGVGGGGLVERGLAGEQHGARLVRVVVVREGNLHKRRVDRADALEQELRFE